TRLEQQDEYHARLIAPRDASVIRRTWVCLARNGTGQHDATVLEAAGARPNAHPHEKRAARGGPHCSSRCTKHDARDRPPSALKQCAAWARLSAAQLAVCQVHG